MLCTILKGRSTFVRSIRLHEGLCATFVCIRLCKLFATFTLRLRDCSFAQTFERHCFALKCLETFPVICDIKTMTYLKIRASRLQAPLVKKERERLQQLGAFDRNMTVEKLRDFSLSEEWHIKLYRCRYLDPVVQSIVSLTISLRHKFVKQISAKVTNTLIFC